MTSLKDLIEGSDLDVFINSGEFAVEAVFNGTFGPYAVKGIYDKGEPVFNDSTGQADAELTLLTVKTEDFEIVKNHDTVTIGNNTYNVETYNHDGTGLTVLTLYKTRED